jgi:uncharacterized membrane protein YqgA involved in biofilm formation
MNSLMGLFGAFVLALGGAILYEGLYVLFSLNTNPQTSPSTVSAFCGFTGFLLIGIGLWVIVLSGKSETK